MSGAQYRIESGINQDKSRLQLTVELAPRCKRFLKSVWDAYTLQESTLPQDKDNIWWSTRLSEGKRVYKGKNERIALLNRKNFLPIDHEWLSGLSVEEKRAFAITYFSQLYDISPSFLYLLHALAYCDNKYGLNNHVSQTYLGKLAAKLTGKKKPYSRAWVNKTMQALCYLGIITQPLGDPHRTLGASCRSDRCCRYALGWWARDLVLRRELSLHMPSLAAKLHQDFTLINTRELVSDNRKEKEEFRESLFEENRLPDDMSLNEWRRGALLRSRYARSFVGQEEIQKAKRSEPCRAISEGGERSLSVYPGRDGEKRVLVNLVAPRPYFASVASKGEPAAFEMTNSVESVKISVNKGLFDSSKTSLARTSMEHNYIRGGMRSLGAMVADTMTTQHRYAEDEDAQPYKGSYNKPTQPESHRATVKFVPAQYETRSPAEAELLRSLAMEDPAFIETYEKNIKLMGKEYADIWIQKVLDNTNKKQVAPAHSVVTSRTI